jgi:hypothetical protein
LVGRFKRYFGSNQRREERFPNPIVNRPNPKAYKPTRSMAQIQKIFKDQEIQASQSQKIKGSTAAIQAPRPRSKR